MDFSKGLFRLFFIGTILSSGSFFIGSAFADFSDLRSLEDDSSSVIPWFYRVPVGMVDAFGELAVLHVTSDAEAGFTDIKLVLDEDYNILGLRHYTIHGFKADISMNQLRSGAVLSNQGGYDVAKIVANLNSKSGGNIDLVYLSNGITNSYDRFSMELVHTGNHWGLQVSDRAGRREFTTMYLEAKKFFGKIIGIKNVIVK